MHAAKESKNKEINRNYLTVLISAFKVEVTENLRFEKVQVTLKTGSGHDVAKM